MGLHGKRERREEWKKLLQQKIGKHNIIIHLHNKVYK